MLMAKTLEHPRAAAILLKLLADDPSMVEFLNRDNLVDFIKLELYDGHDLKLTAKGRKFVQQHLSKQEDPDEGSWHGDFSRNPKKRNPKIEDYKGWGIYEIRTPASIGFYSSGRGGKTIRGRHFFWAEPPENSSIEGREFKTLAATRKFISAHAEKNPRKKKNVSNAKFEQVISDYFEEI